MVQLSYDNESHFSGSTSHTSLTHYRCKRCERCYLNSAIYNIYKETFVMRQKRK